MLSLLPSASIHMFPFPPLRVCTLPRKRFGVHHQTCSYANIRACVVNAREQHSCQTTHCLWRRWRRSIRKLSCQRALGIRSCTKPWCHTHALCKMVVTHLREPFETRRPRKQHKRAHIKKVPNQAAPLILIAPGILLDIGSRPTQGSMFPSVTMK